MNLKFRYDVIVFGMPWSLTISLKYKLIILVASSVLLHEAKCIILDKQSTTIIIESLFLELLGKPNTKSMLTYFQRALATRSGVCKPELWLCDLAYDMSYNVIWTL
jgi:hypothetical protein